MNNFDLSKKGIFKYTLPILCSAILEELIILSDSVLLSFKDPVYIATVGVIDSIYLLFLAFGESLNDAFQNFYARHIEKKSILGDLLKSSIGVFSITALLFSSLIVVILWSCRLCGLTDEHFNIIYDAKWYFCFLLFVTYISLALNSMLMGLGNTKSLGIISIISVFVNLLVGYYLLFKCNLAINPCCIVLLSSIIAESFAIILMIITICKKNSIDHYFSEVLKHKNKIINVLAESAFYPCVSDLAFHIGTILLYSYCLYCFDDSETAILTLLMSYWGFIQVPAQSFSETGLNIFSYLYTEKKFDCYRPIRKDISNMSVKICILFGLIIALFDLLMYDHSWVEFVALSLIIVLGSINSWMEIISVGLIVRLKSDNYLASHLIYGISSIVLILVFTKFTSIGYISIFISFLISIIICMGYLFKQEMLIWKSNNH